jgi:hypothetical protein
MNLNRRLAMLERGFSTEPTVLIMPDGRTVSINGPGDYLMQLLGVAVDGVNVSSEQAAHPVSAASSACVYFATCRRTASSSALVSPALSPRPPQATENADSTQSNTTISFSSIRPV